MKLFFKKSGTLLKETFNEFIEDNGLRLSASLSYYTIFSLPPLLIIIISLSGVFFGNDAVEGHLFSQINGIVGNEAAIQIQEMLKNIKLSGVSVFASIIGVTMLIIGASSVFAEIQDSINYIWGIKAKPKKGFIKFIMNRLMSFSMIVSVGFILLIGLVINALMDILSDNITKLFPADTFYLFYVINIVIVFIIITILFTVIFKTLPDGKVALRDCVLGASFTATLFMLGKFAIGVYVSNTSIASVYGTAASVILIILWVYYSAIILYFGAEFTKVYALLHGKKIIPNRYSVKIVKPKEED